MVAKTRAESVKRLASLPGVTVASEITSLEQGEESGRVIPVVSPLRKGFPSFGLPRGNTVAVHDSTSLLLALLAEATKTGSWVAVVGMPDLGLAAAAELGVELTRVVLIPEPGAQFVSVVAALFEGVDLVVADFSLLEKVSGTKSAHNL